MSENFLFRPHVAGIDAITTPDVLIERIELQTVSNGQRRSIPLPVDRLTAATAIQVVGDATAADAAVLIVAASTGPLIGLAADHFDTLVAAQSPDLARQICAKPLCRTVWRYADVTDHLDRLFLRSWARNEKGDEFLTQEGELGSFTTINSTLTSQKNPSDQLSAGLALLCSGLTRTETQGPVSGVRLQLSDPVIGRTIDHDYQITCLQGDNERR